MGLSAHQSAHMDTDVWLTPPEILAPLGEFDLDPCACITQHWVPARRVFFKSDDGLVQDWFGRVWMNPPFGRAVGDWLKKLADHGNGIALVAARTETEWFVSQVWKRANAVLFIHGRPHFYYPSGVRAKFNSGAPIALIAYGCNNVLSLQNSGLGTMVQWWK